jgi:hypothetical protein
VTDKTNPDGDRKASRTSTYLRALKIPATLLLVALAFLVAYYSLYVRNSLGYLKGRDLRLLATVGAQVQASIEDHEKVLSSFANYYGPRVFASQFDCIVKEATRASIDIFAYVSPALPGGGRAPASVCPSDTTIQPAAQAGGPMQPIRARFIDDAGTAWTRNKGPGEHPAEEVSFRIDLNRMLAPLFAHQVGDDVFDQLMLVAPSGRVIYSEGSPDLQLTSLDGILRRQPDGNWKEQVFAGTGRVSQVLDLQISGGQYVLYLQPCCRNLFDSPQLEKEPGWVIAGLTESGKLRSTSMAVSFSVMAFLGGLILLAVFSWPFLKLTLMGQENRLRLIDVIAVGICSLLIISLVMLFLVDWYSYRRLKEDLDRQLEALSGDVQHNVGDEISRAYDQMQSLDVWTDGVKDAGRVSNLFEQPGMETQDDATYPFFESFALINPDGMQHRKWAVANFATPLIPTATREYFRHWQDHRPPPATGVIPTDADARAADAYAHTFLESIRSATTGRKEAVLSAPTHLHTGITVASLTIPMVSLNEVALPPGFKFAVIDARGRVMFHSDPRHNLDEQFFLEADSSRRLRSAVAARRDENLNIRYFGQDYRAYVAPLASLNGSSWSIVTMFDRQLLRTVNIEWLVTTMLFTVIYASLYIVICVLVLLLKPAYRAPWIWPDPAKRLDYQHLIVVYAVFAAACVLAMYGLRGRHLLTFGWVAPFIVWMSTYLTLSRNAGVPVERRWMWRAAALGMSVLLLSLVAPAGPSGVAVGLLMLAGVLTSAIRIGPRVPNPYLTAAMLLLALTAVIPTAAFFQVAHAIQIDSYIKYGQLTLAREVQSRLERLSQQPGQASGRPAVLRGELGRYGKFFYQTQVVDVSAGMETINRVCEGAGSPDADQQDPRYELPKVLEDFLPYYSESSVGMRELLHDRSSDRAWDWHRKGATLLLHTPRNAGWNTACVRTELPAFSQAGIVSFDTAGKGTQLGALAVIALCAVFWIVRFMTRRVFLADVIEPLWARRAAAIPVHPGEHLYLVWRPADRKQRALVEEGMYVVDLEKVTEPIRDWFAAERDRLEQLPTGQTVVIDHLDARTGEAAFDEYKVGLVRNALDVQHRTVVIVSALRPTSLLARIADGAAPGVDEGRHRWMSLLGRFTVLEGIRFEGPAVATATVTELAATATTAAPAAPASHAAVPARTTPVTPVTPAAPAAAPAAPLVSGGLDGDPVVRSVWEEVYRSSVDASGRTSLDEEQIHEEVGDRLDNYHRGIWASCSDAQKRVLKHLGRDGLVNEKNRRTVRLLLARGLVRKDPNFRFVSESFRRFVMFRIPAADAAAIELRSTSAWDAVRLPFLVTLLAVSAFFFLTQRELFTTTIAVITALAGGIPAIVRVAGLFERQSERSNG